MHPSPKAVTQWLVDGSHGHQEALDQLMPLVYEELRRLARGYLGRRRRDHTLQATALVHEAYLRLVDQTHLRWQNRAHFCGIAARGMRQILVNHAIKHQAAKRGGPRYTLSLDEALGVSNEPSVDLIALDEALNCLARLDPRKSRLVELRFFSGLSIEETAEVLGISPATVKREWSSAKAWLYNEIKQQS